MSTPEQEALEARHMRTLWLMGAAAASLILPLLGVFYIRMNDAPPTHPPTAAVVFDRREAGEAKINITQTAVAKPSRTRGEPNSSLSFVKGADYYQEKPAQTPKAAAPAAPAPSPPKATSKRGVKKSFSAPKLQGVKSFNNFKNAAARKASSQDSVLKNLPPGSENNPDVQKLLESQGQ